MISRRQLRAGLLIISSRKAMRDFRKFARKVLNYATLTDFYELIREAKINDEDTEIIVLKFVQGFSIVQIAEKLHCSPEKIKASIKRSYDRVYKVLKMRSE